MATKWQRVRIQVPKSLTPTDRLILADLVIDRITDRTQNEQVDRSGKSFPRYTEEYANEKNTARSDVDLTLSGDMLDALKLLSHKSGSILIGYERGTELNARADGNIRGTYGKPSPNPAKARDFLGVSRSELSELIREIG